VIHGRKRLSSTLLGATAVAAIGLVPVTPAQADPDIDDVKSRVDSLYHQAEVAQERYHDAKLELDELRKDLGALKADQRRQDQRLRAVRAQVSDTIVRQYQGESASTVGQVLVADDPSAFLGQLSTMSAFSDMQTSLFDSYSTERKALALRKGATSARTAEIAKTTERLRSEKETVADKLAEAKGLLSELEAEEREQVVSRSSEPAPAPASVPASGGAAAAVNYALAQVGDAYVYGATGENAFDCSGLTMRAWAQAGVALPHSSSAQMGSGPRVSGSSLQPGDLVFYYSPVSHVGIYIGNGQIVHAANPSTGVQVTGVYSMPFSGAVRPG
jgi:cell wall-associated NlpC family hydrolase